MCNAKFILPDPVNEPILAYRSGSPEREELKEVLDKMSNEQIEIPLIIGGQDVKTGNTATCVMPHNHKHVLAVYHKAGSREVEIAVEASQEAWKTWSVMPWWNAQVFSKKPRRS